MMPRPLIAAAIIVSVAFAFWMVEGTAFYDKVVPYQDSVAYQGTYLSIIDDYEESGLEASGRAIMARNARSLLYPILTGVFAPVLPRSIAGLYLVSYATLAAAFAIVMYGAYRLTKSAWATLFVVLFVLSFAVFDYPIGGPTDQRTDLISGMLVLATCLAAWLLVDQPERSWHWALAGSSAGICLLQRPLTVTQFPIFALALVLVMWSGRYEVVRRATTVRRVLWLVAPLAVAAIALVPSAGTIWEYYVEENADVGLASSWRTAAGFATYNTAVQIGVVPLVLVVAAAGWTCWRRQWREALLTGAAAIAGAGVFVATRSGSNEHPLQAAVFLSTVVVVAALRVTPGPVVRVGVVVVAGLALWNAVHLGMAVRDQSTNERDRVEQALATLSAELPAGSAIHGTDPELRLLMALGNITESTTLRAGRGFSQPGTFGLLASAKWSESTKLAVAGAARSVCDGDGSALLLPSPTVKDSPQSRKFVLRYAEEIGAVFRSLPCRGDEIVRYMHNGVEWQVLRLAPVR